MPIAVGSIMDICDAISDLLGSIDAINAIESTVFAYSVWIWAYTDLFDH